MCWTGIPTGRWTGCGATLSGASAIQSLAEELRQLLLFRAAVLEEVPDLTEAQKASLHEAFDAVVELAKWFESLARAAGDARLEAQRIQDPDTGLFNRRYLEIAPAGGGGTLLAVRPSPCLLAARVNQWEQILGRWGLQAVQEVAHPVAQVLQRVSRAVDTKFYLEPDEFCVLMPEANPDHAFVIAERVREAVEAFAPYGATVSVGAACCPCTRAIPRRCWRGGRKPRSRPGVWGVTPPWCTSPREPSLHPAREVVWRADRVR